MKTLTVTEARANLSAVLEKVKQGEEIGIISGNKIVQLKPVEVVPWESTYVFQEYGVTADEWERFEKKMGKRRKKGGYIRFKAAFDPSEL